jgi:hypothetical protein
MENEIKVNDYMSRKEYNKKYNSDVGYSLLVQNNIKRDDYARLNTGLICKVIGIKENNCNKKAIYFGIYEQDWFDCSAVENFSNDLADLIEVNDIAIMSYNGIVFQKFVSRDDIVALKMKEYRLLEILTKEQFESISYKVERNN